MGKLSDFPELQKGDGNDYPLVESSYILEVVSHKTGKKVAFEYYDVTQSNPNEPGCYVHFHPNETLDSVVTLIIHRDMKKRRK